MSRSFESKNADFTLLEPLVVLVIFGLSIARPQVMKYLSRARSQSAALQIHNLAAALDLFRLDIGAYPSQELGLKSLVEAPPNLVTWSGPYVKRPEMINDPWGHPYIYRVPGEHVTMTSCSLRADNYVGGRNQDTSNW